MLEARGAHGVVQSSGVPDVLPSLPGLTLNVQVDASEFKNLTLSKKEESDDEEQVTPSPPPFPRHSLPIAPLPPPVKQCFTGQASSLSRLTSNCLFLAVQFTKAKKHGKGKGPKAKEVVTGSFSVASSDAGPPSRERTGRGGGRGRGGDRGERRGRGERSERGGRGGEMMAPHDHIWLFGTWKGC